MTRRRTLCRAALDGAYYQPFSNGGKTIYMVVDDPTASH